MSYTLSEPQDGPDILAINRARRIVLATDGRVFAMETLFDFEGDQTDDASEAVVCIFNEPQADGTLVFCVLDMRDFDEATIQ